MSADERGWRKSFYCATVDGEPADWMTIGPVCEPEARFHYNAVENAIIEALTKLYPIPEMRKVWRFAQSRAEWRVLDVGSGTGHWIDFFLEVYLAAQVTGIELTAQMAGFLREKYAGEDSVQILQADVSEPLTIEPVDIVSAIGVMFHIIDDARWLKAIENLASVLKNEGLMIVGGDFGDETRDVQFHKTDRFNSWAEHDAAEGAAAKVNNRVRSFDAWQHAASEFDLEVVDLVRTARHLGIWTPENNVLVLRKRGT